MIQLPFFYNLSESVRFPSRHNIECLYTIYPLTVTNLPTKGHQFAHYRYQFAHQRAPIYPFSVTNLPTNGIQFAHQRWWANWWPLLVGKLVTVVGKWYIVGGQIVYRWWANCIYRWWANCIPFYTLFIHKHLFY